MNIRYQLSNLTTSHPLEVQGVIIRLHVQRHRYDVKRYYTVECGEAVWKSPVFTMPYAEYGSLLYDGDPLAEHRAAIQAVIRCIETEGWKPHTVHIETRVCGYHVCQKSFVPSQRTQRYCSRKCYQCASARRNTLKRRSA